MRLARWEDRGFYAQRQATDRAQRQLQALATKAQAALSQPAGPVLAQAANAMALDDLSPASDPAVSPEGKGGGRLGERGSVDGAEAARPATVRTAQSHCENAMFCSVARGGVGE